MRMDVTRAAFKEAGCVEETYSEMGVLAVEWRGRYGRTISNVMC